MVQYMLAISFSDLIVTVIVDIFYQFSSKSVTLVYSPPVSNCMKLILDLCPQERRTKPKLIKINFGIRIRNLNLFFQLNIINKILSFQCVLMWMGNVGISDRGGIQNNFPCTPVQIWIISVDSYRVSRFIFQHFVTCPGNVCVRIRAVVVVLHRERHKIGQISRKVWYIFSTEAQWVTQSKKSRTEYISKGSRADRQAHSRGILNRGFAASSPQVFNFWIDFHPFFHPLPLFFIFTLFLPF